MKITVETNLIKTEFLDIELDPGLSEVHVLHAHVPFARVHLEKKRTHACTFEAHACIHACVRAKSAHFARRPF